MANLEKISENMNTYTEEVIKKLDIEIVKIKEASIATKFDKHITKKIANS